MLLSVSQGDWLASFDLREAYIPVTVPPTSRPFLRFLLRDTVYQFQALCFGLHGSAGLHLGHGSCFSYTPFSGYPYASIPRHLAGPVFLSGVSPRGSSTCPPTLSSFWDCHPSQVFQPHTFPGVQCLWVVFDSTSFRASPSVERISRRHSTTAVFMSCA